jgi:hypothetical protein
MATLNPFERIALYSSSNFSSTQVFMIFNVFTVNQGSNSFYYVSGIASVLLVEKLFNAISSADENQQKPQYPFLV